MSLQGMGQLLVNHWGGIRWLLRDDFNDTRAAGAVNGTPATPGPGTRVVTDTAAGLSVGSGICTLIGKGTIGDPGLRWLGETRIAGKMLLGQYTTSTLYGGVGWWNDTILAVANTENEFHFREGVTNLSVYNLNVLLSVGTVAVATSYQWAIILRTAGAFFLIKGGTYTNWTLVWQTLAGANATLYPAVTVHSGTPTTSYFRIPDALWLLSPLAYDTFTRANGAPGSTEGTGPDGQSAPALAWATVAGTPAINANTLVFTAAGIAVLPALSTADLLNTWKITTPAAGVTAGGIIVRYTDADNYWYVRLIPGTAGTDFQLIERNATVETARATADIDWVAATAYQVCVVCHGSTWWKIYQGTTSPATLSLDYTAANTFNQTAGITGVRDEGNSNFIFDDMRIWARGTNGEYAALNKYST